MTRVAFGKNKRATTASDLVDFLGDAFEKRFPADQSSYASAEESAMSAAAASSGCVAAQFRSAM